MSKRQYVVAKFRLTDSRTFTYHNDGEPVKAGDEIKVHDPRGGGDAWKRVYVTHVHHTKPSGFETKEILGLAPPKEERPVDAAPMLMKSKEEMESLYPLSDDYDG